MGAPGAEFRAEAGATAAQAGPVARRAARRGGGGEHLPRSIGTFQLAMFGVGATVGTGIFFVMSAAVPEAGPAVIVVVRDGRHRGGPRAICYAEMASSVPVSGSTYSYAYATLGEIVAMGVAACLLLEYGVSTAAVAVGWSGYLNEALRNITGIELPHAILAAPWDAEPGDRSTCPRWCWSALCMLLLIRGASESAQVNAIMVVIKLDRAGDVHRHRVHGLRRRPLRRLRAVRGRGRGHRGRHDLLLVHRPRRRVHRGRRGEGPAEDDAAGADRRAVHRHHLLRAGGGRGGGHPAVAGRSRASPRRVSRRSWRTSPATPSGARSWPSAPSSRSSRSPW